MTTSSLSSAPPFLRIEHLVKDFNGFKAVNDVSLDIAKGEIFALLGSSGCGKTTLLRMLAGFETPTSGRIAFRYVVDNVATAGNYLGIDNVSVTSAVPEPATYVLMGLGVAALLKAIISAGDSPGSASSRTCRVTARSVACMSSRNAKRASACHRSP